MEVTGYTFKEAIKMAILELDTVRSTFDESLYAFADEEKQDPVEIAKRIEELEGQIAQLQTAQAEYNLTVTVEVSVDVPDGGYQIGRWYGAARQNVAYCGKWQKR